MLIKIASLWFSKSTQINSAGQEPIQCNLRVRMTMIEAFIKALQGMPLLEYFMKYSSHSLKSIENGMDNNYTVS